MIVWVAEPLEFLLRAAQTAELLLQSYAAGQRGCWRTFAPWCAARVWRTGRCAEELLV